jgi:hypothetical protein
MTDSIDLAIVSATLQRLLEQAGDTVTYTCPTDGAASEISAELAASPAGLLPAFLTAADALWREATVGKSFQAKIAANPNAMLGFSVQAIHGGTFTTVMLAIMEAAEQATEFRVLHANRLAAVWERAEDRISFAGEQPACA